MVAFSIWMDTHKSRSVLIHQGFFMFQSSHWHGPCTSDDTLPFGWLKKEAAAAASGFFPRLGIAVPNHQPAIVLCIRRISCSDLE